MNLKHDSGRGALGGWGTSQVVLHPRPTRLVPSFRREVCMTLENELKKNSSKKPRGKSSKLMLQQKES
jgi:hypothetical protein